MVLDISDGDHLSSVVMTASRSRNQQLATVIRLACLIEDRTDDEQRALISWAWDCDREHNKNTTTNRDRRRPDWRLQDLVGLVDATRVLEERSEEDPAAEAMG